MVQIAWIQGKSQGSIAANLDYYQKKIKDLKASDNAEKLELIILPELFLTDYFAIEEKPENFDLAFLKDSFEVKSFCKLASELKVAIVFPFFEKVSSALFFNSLYLIDSRGEINCHYRKMHIPDDPGFYEKYYFRPGDLGFKVANLSENDSSDLNESPTGLKLGTLICWDQWFPEAARITALKGANVLIYPTAIGWDAGEPEAIYQDQLEAWFSVMRSHAIANNVYVIAVNRVGQEGHLNFWGNSFCVDPYGKIVHRDSTDETVSVFEIDLNKIEEARRIWPYFRDRRVDVYGDLEKLWLE
ncbi:MAG: carbon-nitrogen hydrolase [Candidatus Caenarcaniphilales bacterium]|nr:carbon-nitrogen hydrolase [Candidatus Caenarcaniphilales bacterium]